ncbi:MAG: hypothetical protein ACREMB_20420, partial [Candidatus Rokuibacteriota bacterium]
MRARSIWFAAVVAAAPVLALAGAARAGGGNVEIHTPYPASRPLVGQPAQSWVAVQPGQPAVVWQRAQPGPVVV